jgi:hypothetical protein
MAMMAGYKRHRTSGPRKPRNPKSPKSPGLPPSNSRRKEGNTPEDAAVEAQQRASGVLVEEKTSALSPEEQARRDIEQAIAGDAGLHSRPQMRRLIKRLMAEKCCNVDGSPMVVVGSDGKRTTLNVTWEEAVARTIFGNVLKGDLDWAKLLAEYWLEKQRTPLELSGPNGGPIETSNRTELPSEQEMAARLLRARDIARKVIEAEGAPIIDGIEVSANTCPNGNPLPPPGALPAVPPAPPAEPSVRPPGPSPATAGMIPIRR